MLVSSIVKVDKENKHNPSANRIKQVEKNTLGKETS